MSFIPIKEISPYGRKGWSIKARVTSRQNVRTFQKKMGGGEGKVFNLDLMDEQGTEIRASLWGVAVDKFDAMLQKGKVYIFTGGQAKLANKNYNNTGHNYELNFDEAAMISLVENDEALANVKVKMTGLVQLRKLATMAVPTNVNTCVVVTNIGDTREVKTKTNKDMTVRKVMVADASECDLEVSMWNECAALCNDKIREGTVICIKGMKVGDYSGRNGSVFDASSIHTGLDLPECKEVEEWWQKSKGLTLRNLSNGEKKATDGGENKKGSLKELDVEVGKLQEGQTLYWDCQAYFSFLILKRKGMEQPVPLWYAACTKCGKKIAGDDCVSCNVRVSRPQMKYLLSGCLIEDESATRWVSCFDNVGQELMGVSADQLAASTQGKGANETLVEVGKIVEKRYLQQQYKLRIKAKSEVYQGVARPRVQVMTATPVESDLKADMARLLANELEASFEGASPEAQAEVRAFLQGSDGFGLQDWDLPNAAPVAAPALERLQAVACA